MPPQSFVYQDVTGLCFLFRFRLFLLLLATTTGGAAVTSASVGSTSAFRFFFTLRLSPLFTLCSFCVLSRFRFFPTLLLSLTSCGPLSDVAKSCAFGLLSFLADFFSAFPPPRVCFSLSRRVDACFTSSRRVGASSRRVGASSRRVGTSSRRVGASSRRVGASTRVGACADAPLSKHAMKKPLVRSARGSRRTQRAASPSRASIPRLAMRGKTGTRWNSSCTCAKQTPRDGRVTHVSHA